ncbi:NUDIX domain-containing protein [Amnibacterium sp. CER49]|uniref:NUDIX hydrolase n=1 Tax=Amnibacterium sp. CER49 TaxID=3039161 RepID=UPI00244895E3|nr:NUDIX domain-containing protein [Amnibacterium sp. CER49]MDH2443401.1 NUDIX domain-containing protein [Amnibacterium sp. CER49]
MPEALSRNAARVLLLDQHDRVLLIQGSDPAAPELGSWWITPGGDLEPDETPEVAAVREVWEETGLELHGVTGPLWERTSTFPFDGVVVTQHEQYFTVRVPHFEPAGAALTDLEQRATIAMRWWTADEVRGTAERVYPENLPELLTDASARV